MWVLFSLGVILGTIIGWTVCLLIFLKPAGKMIVNETDPEKEVWTMDFFMPLEKIKFYKQVTLRVVNESSRKKNMDHDGTR